MANTVNGIAAITANTQREVVDLETGCCFSKVHPNQVMRARVALDTAADFAIDDPTVDNTFGFSASQRIYVVGYQISTALANTITFKTKTGAAAAINLMTYNLGATAILDSQTMGEPTNIVTDRGAALLVNAFGPATIILHYVFATQGTTD